MDQDRIATRDVELTQQPRSLAGEQRRASRKSLRLTAQIELPHGKRLCGHTADISRDGIGFFAPIKIEVGEDCRLTIEIVACGTREVLVLVGRVCHCTKQSEDSFRVGMKFIRMDERTASIVCAALR
jgi:hypothetical protein